MRLLIPSLLAVFALAAPLRAQSGDESAKAGSGERFLEKGGGGGVEGSAVYAANGGGRSAEELVNSDARAEGLKTNAPPAPKGDKLAQAQGGIKGAAIGGMAGGIAGGVLGSAVPGVGTAAGIYIGGTLGALAGAAIGILLAGKASEGTTGAIENRNRQIDDIVNQ